MAMKRQREHCLCLQKYDPEDVCDLIKVKKLNDVNYEQELKDTMWIFSKHHLNGSKIYHLNGDDLRCMMKYKLAKFITGETIDIMFNHFDKLKDQQQDAIKVEKAAKIASVLYYHPLNLLLDKIMNENINGQELINLYNKNESVIREVTGWSVNEAYQIEASLFQKQTLTQESILNKLNDNDSLPTFAIDQIRNTFQKFSLETVHYKIKYGKHSDKFSDSIINLAADLNNKITHDKDEKSDSIYVENDLVKIIYNAIAECFMWNYAEHKIDKNVASLRKYDWTCFNCSNRNFCSVNGNKLDTDLTRCILCGITEKNSIVFNIRNQNSFTMVKQLNYNKTHVQDDQKQYDTEQIQQVIKARKLQLVCPDTNNNEHCPSVIELSKMLMKYKNILECHGILPAPDISQLKLSSSKFKTIFIEAAQEIAEKIKLHRKLIDSLQQFIQKFDKNDEIICAIQEQAKLGKKAFTNILKSYEIKGKTSIKLWKQIKKKLLLNEFLSNVDIKIANQHYKHIYESHINCGNIETIKNVFLFFQNVLHYNDSKTTNDCLSLERRNSRQHRTMKQAKFTEKQVKFIEKQEKDIDLICQSEIENENIYEFNQYYIQNRLDAIHCTLSHTDYKQYLPKYADQKERYEHAEDETQITCTKHVDKDKLNTTKYISYGFGIPHDHTQLCPSFNSIRSELLFNSISPIEDDIFQIQMIKSIQTKDSIETEKSSTQRNNNGSKLITKCQYYDPQYNILRNEPIGIRHILSMTIYSDLTDFCTAFRETFRKMPNEDDRDVIERHTQLYYYARSLSEAVQFFGCYMKENEKVRHGLTCGSELFCFHKFRAHFHQPISTSSSFKVAKQFTQGNGLVLTLKSASKCNNDKHTTPKYSLMSWLSDFGSEEEKLFYSSHVAFRIVNIHCFEGKRVVDHQKELILFNKLQDVLENQTVEWENDQHIVHQLVSLIKRQLNSGKHAMEDDEKKSNEDDSKFPEMFTEYGMMLFNEYCTHLNRITIKCFDKLPQDLYNVLFSGEFDKDRQHAPSLIVLL
eukprot:481339_1